MNLSPMYQPLFKSILFRFNVNVIHFKENKHFEKYIVPNFAGVGLHNMNSNSLSFIVAQRCHVLKKCAQLYYNCDS
jgi:hypothetical protein